MSTPTLPPSSLRRPFNPRAPRAPRAYATYGPPSPYRIDARAPLSAVDQRALDAGTHAAVPFVPRSDRAGMQGVLPAKGPGVNSDAVQNLLDRAAGTEVPKNIPTSGASIATPNGTASVRFDKAGGGLTPGGAGPSAPILGADGKQVGVGRVDSNGQPFDINEARSNLQAAYPEVFKEGSDANKAFAAYANTHGEQAAHEHAAELMRPFDAAKATGAASAAQARSELPAPGSSEDVISKAATTKAVGEMAKAKTDAGPFAVGSKGGNIVSAAKNAPSLPDAAGNVVESGARAIGLNDETAKGAGNFVRSAPAKAADEFMNNPNGPVQTAKAAAGYVGDKLSGAAQTVRNMFVPSAPDFPPAGQPGGRLGGTGGVTSPLPGSPVVPLIDPTAANVPPPDDIPNYADGLLAKVGDKIADTTDPDDRAWRAAQPGKLLPNYFPAAGPRSQALMAGAPPRTPYVPSAARDRSTVAAADDVPNYASGDIFPQEQPVFQSTQPTGNMKSAVIAERNDLKAAGFDDQANAASKANANGSWTYDPGQAGATAPQPSAPVAQQPGYGQSAQPHKLNAHDFDNQWPDPAGLRGRVGGGATALGTGPGGAGGHGIPNFAGGYSKAGLEGADDINHVGASALPPNADTSSLEDHSQQIGGDSDIESDEERRKRLEGSSLLARNSVPNLAAGRMPAYAKGRLFAPAMQREAQAIKAGVGGAPATAKPQPVLLAGNPAVINDSEKVMPTPQGPAVLNRSMQKKLKPFVPSRN